MKSLESLWSFIKNKVGRLVTGTGMVLSGIEYFDISVIKDPLEGLIGHKGVQAVAVGLFLASFARHQLVANKHPKEAAMPDPQPGAVVKP